MTSVQLSQLAVMRSGEVDQKTHLFLFQELSIGLQLCIYLVLPKIKTNKNVCL